MKHSLNITILSAFGDNYIYLAEYAPGQCFVIDPGDATVVEKALEQYNLQLTHIFATHHHVDHIGGVKTLKQRFDCSVVGPQDKRIAGLDTIMNDGNIIELADTRIRCIATPGHTSTSVCYDLTGTSLEKPVLFTGDTLFVCGCGRMFECDSRTMFTSLQKLTALPDETRVYPGHDYTEENIRFALMFEPENEALLRKLSEIQAVIGQQNPHGHNPPDTVPSTLAEEKKLNPFLKVPDWQTFTHLRKQKDVF